MARPSTFGSLSRALAMFSDGKREQEMVNQQLTRQASLDAERQEEGRLNQALRALQVGEIGEARDFRRQQATAAQEQAAAQAQAQAAARDALAALAQGYTPEKEAAALRAGVSPQAVEPYRPKAAPTMTPYQAEQLKIQQAQLALAQQKANAPKGKAAGGASTRPPTEGMRKAQALLMTATQANDLLRQFGAKEAPSWLDAQKAKVGLGAGNFLTSDEFQQLNQAALQLSDAWLRYTSGSAVPESEVQRFAQGFLPRPGDSVATLRQKTAARETIIKAMRQGAGVSIPDAAAAVQDYVLPNTPDED